jgi:2-amino-4-hydroxy-6-hydroxymethyldihydropteridine diphosphokinase
MNKVYLSLGSNEGDRVLWLTKAINEISRSAGDIINKSSIYETAAWGKNDQPDFLNMVLEISTQLDAHDLLNVILAIETSLGRHRDEKWGPRIIDIDILFYGHYIIYSPQLTIPHPYLQDRMFVLVPLAELNPAFEHPIFLKSIAEMLKECEDTLEVRLFLSDK